jgi:hypothetical protein
VGLDFAYFGALASILVEEDFRVVRIATRRSTATTLHELAQDVVDVLEHLGISEAGSAGTDSAALSRGPSRSTITNE